jgi:hypothetical protein
MRGSWFWAKINVGGEIWTNLDVSVLFSVSAWVAPKIQFCICKHRIVTVHSRRYALCACKFLFESELSGSVTGLVTFGVFGAGYSGWRNRVSRETTSEKGLSVRPRWTDPCQNLRWYASRSQLHAGFYCEESACVEAEIWAISRGRVKFAPSYSIAANTGIQAKFRF